MTTFFIALAAVVSLLLVAVPGYLMMRFRLVGEDCIPGISKILVFVCQPCLAIYTFKSTPFSVETLCRMGIFTLLVLGINVFMLGISFLILRKKSKEPVYRIMTIATTFGNCAFFGIPIIEALLPGQASDLVLYTTIYAFVMNVLGWTVGSAIIAQDCRHISLKKIFLNPAMLGTAFALLLFVLEVPIQEDLLSMITICGRMASPLSMLVMGMRLATCNLRQVVTSVQAYIAIFVKQCIMPLVALAIVWFLPIDISMKQTFYIICACPVASIVLNYSEIVGAGQRDGATMVLLGTGLSIVTLPLMMLLLPLIA